MISVGMTFFHFGGMAAFDFGFHDCISGGIASGYSGYGFSTNWRYNYVPIVGRAAFHPFNLKVLADKIPVRDKVDVYVGPSIGYSIGWATWRGSGPEIGDPDVGWFVFREYIGVKYFFNDVVAGYIEDCAGLGWICMGVTLNF